MVTEKANPREERALLISSDGHASAKMADYRPYIPASYREEFDAFCVRYAEVGIRSSDPGALALHLDPDILELWVQNMVERDRLSGFSDPARRIEVMDEEGIAADVLFPDFGMPFQMGGPVLEFKLGHTRTPEQQAVAAAAYNRWLADYCAYAPERFRGMAVVSFDDHEAAVQEIRWARQAGLNGVLLPMFSEKEPLYAAKFDPIWSVLEELDMPVNSHGAMSGTSDQLVQLPSPHPAAAIPLLMPVMFFYCHQVLNHMIWGGVFERHPNLKVVFTEQGSGWIPGSLTAMNFTWEGSYLRRDIREITPRRPSEYFARQCYVGASLFSRAEIEIRDQIGLDKIMIGTDYPHHEGTFAGAGTREYLKATLGAAHVPAGEARQLLGINAGRLWNFDLAKLQPVADKHGPLLRDILTEPQEDLFPRGDVHKPIVAGI